VLIEKRNFRINKVIENADWRRVRSNTRIRF
jgi:hypothetical protein